MGRVISITADAASYATIDKIASGITKHIEWSQSPALMQIGVGVVGTYWYNNMMQEGKLTGRPWAKLSAVTQEVRERRRVGRDGPILRQSQSLYYAAIGGLIQTLMVGTSYGRQIAPSRAVTGVESRGGAVVGGVAPRRFWATVSGPKALNQTGGYQTYLGINAVEKSGDKWWGSRTPGGTFLASEALRTYVPARPFWYFNQVMLESTVTEMARMYARRVASNLGQPMTFIIPQGRRMNVSHYNV